MQLMCLSFFIHKYSRMTVKLGATKLGETGPNAQDIRVKKIIPHPKCEFEENNHEIYKYDIALLWLVKIPSLTGN